MKSIFVVIALFLPLISTASQSTLIDFAIEDQFGRVRTNDEFENKVVILVGSGRASSENNEKWGNAIGAWMDDQEVFDTTRVIFIPHADLSAVPKMLRPVARTFFPKKDSTRWALLDWEGKLTDAYDYVADKSNILIFDKNHHLQLHIAGTEPEEEKLARIYQTLAEVLKQE